MKQKNYKANQMFIRNAFFMTFIYMSLCLIPTVSAQWQQTNGTFGMSISSFATIDSGILASSSGGGVLRSSDNGSTWTTLNNGLTNTVVKSIAVKGKKVLAATIPFGLFLSFNSGMSWTDLSNNLPPNSYMFSIAWCDIGILAGTLTGLLLSTDTGTTWTIVNSSSVYMTVTNGNDIFSGTIGQGVIHSTDSCQSWAPINNGLTNLMIMSLANNGTTLYAGTIGSGLFLSYNNGQSWTPINQGINTDTVFGLAISGTTVLAGLYSKGVYLTTDNGLTWTDINQGLVDSTIGPTAISGPNFLIGTNSHGVWKRPISDFLGIETPKANNKLRIYPNPFTNSTVITFNEIQNNTSIRIFNLLGKEIKSTFIRGVNNYMISKETMQSGLYFVHIIDINNTMIIKKIIVQ